MNNEELNARIRAVVDQKDFAPAGESKCIPYAGWCWRFVDFDATEYRFKIVKEDDYDKAFIAFQGNTDNAWAETRPTTPEEWANIKALIVAAVSKPTVRAFGLVHEAIYAIYDPTCKSGFSWEVELEL